MGSFENIDLEECLRVAADIAKEAGEEIKHAFYSVKTVSTKSSDVDLVTETDVKIEKQVRARLQDVFPSHRFIGEETTADGHPCDLTDLPTWIVDPIDGTSNFVNGLHEVGFSVGLTINKQSVIGVINFPLLGQLYTARTGHGAFCNGEKITVRPVEELREAVVILNGGSSGTPEVLDIKAKNFRTMLTHCRGVRMDGASTWSFCRLAGGQGQACVLYNLHCWDMAAGAVLVREAGGVLMDPTGDKFDLLSRRVLCAATPKLAQQITPLLSHIYQKRD